MFDLGYNTGVVNRKNDRGAIGVAHGLSKSLGRLTVQDHTPNAPALKVCPNCKESKPDSSFGIRKTGRDAGQRRSWCKSCEAAYKRANRSRYTAHEAARRDANREEYNAYMRGWQASRPDHRAALNAVNNAVIAGKLPHVSTLPCDKCGAQADHYHHCKGYGEQNRLDVVPLCRNCHEQEHHQND